MKKLLLATILWAIGLGHPQAYASSGIEQTAPIFSLPDEMLYEVCLYLPSKDLLTLTRTSHDFRRIASDKSLEKEIELNVKSWTQAPEIVEVYKYINITDFHLYREVPTAPTEKPQDKPRELHLSLYPTLDKIRELEKTRPNTAILVFSPPRPIP